jgi:hypothetical protein
MPALGLSRFAERMLSRPVGAVAGAAIGLILLGCMSISLDGRPIRIEHFTEDGITCHRGTVHVPANADADVYYPLPFASKPNLELTDPFGNCEIVLQREDCFRVHNTSCISTTAKWKARGPKLAPPEPDASPIVGPPAPVDAPPPECPSEPIPPLPAKPVPTTP